MFSILLTYVAQPGIAQENFSVSHKNRLEIIDALADIEQSKQSWGLTEIDFTCFEIGQPIQTYNYTDSALEESNVLYPIISNGNLILWALPIGAQFQITNGLVKEVNTTVNQDQPFALVYDTDSVYMYSNDTLVLLKQTDQHIVSRNKINNVENVPLSKIKTTSLENTTPLEYKAYTRENVQTRATNVSCNISYVTQNPYDKICWAAAIACISNYKNNTSLNAVTVAQNYYGMSDFNSGINVESFTTKIQDYGLPYYRDAFYGSFDNKIFNSLLADYPVGGAFDVINGAFHATTIFGINILSGRIQVMDPEFGSTTATLASSQYSYVSPVHGTTLVLHAISYDDGT